jgi:hypothetical protein
MISHDAGAIFQLSLTGAHKCFAEKKQEHINNHVSNDHREKSKTMSSKSKKYLSL